MWDSCLWSYATIFISIVRYLAKQEQYLNDYACECSWVCLCDGSFVRLCLDVSTCSSKLEGKGQWMQIG